MNVVSATMLKHTLYISNRYKLVLNQTLVPNHNNVLKATITLLKAKMILLKIDWDILLLTVLVLILLLRQLWLS